MCLTLCTEFQTHAEFEKTESNCIVRNILCTKFERNASNSKHPPNDIKRDEKDIHSTTQPPPSPHTMLVTVCVLCSLLCGQNCPYCDNKIAKAKEQIVRSFDKILILFVQRPCLRAASDGEDVESLIWH